MSDSKDDWDFVPADATPHAHEQEVIEAHKIGMQEGYFRALFVSNTLLVHTIKSGATLEQVLRLAEDQIQVFEMSGVVPPDEMEKIRDTLPDIAEALKAEQEADNA